MIALFRSEREKAWSVSLVLFSLILFSTMPVYAQDFSFETDGVKFVIGEDGIVKSLQEKKGGRELLANPPAPFVTVAAKRRFQPVTSLKPSGEFYRAEFGNSGIAADYRISAGRDYITIELAHLYGPGIDEIRLCQLRTIPLKNRGDLLPVTWDDQAAVSLVGLSERVHTRFGEGMMLSSVYAQYGMEGEKTVLVVAPADRFLEVMQKIEAEFHLPSPKIGGAWSKLSFDAKTSYLFTDLTEANADETIRLAKLAGFKYIMIYSHVWSSSPGSYPVNLQNFPKGEESLKVVIDKCHAAGLKVGMHMLTSLVGKDDAMVSSNPSGLLVKAEAVLASDIDSSARTITAKSGMAHFPAGTTVMIDNELIHYQVVGGPGSTTLVQCTRGYGGTKPVSHSAGAKIQHLGEFYGSYVADMKSDLKSKIAERVASLINDCGFDMVFFDGAEVNCAHGPCWYLAGQQEESILDRVTRALLVQASGVSSWSWHMVTRGYSGDFAAVAREEYLDHYKIPYGWDLYASNFMPAELGWWGLLTSEDDHSATTPDEVEYYAARMLALDSPISIETTLDKMKTNGRTDEMLKLMGEYEKLRLGNKVPPEVRKKLLSGAWHLVLKDGKAGLHPMKYESQRFDAPKTVNVKNDFGKQKFKFRIKVKPGLADIGDPSNIKLLRQGSTVMIASEKGPREPGVPAGRLDFVAPPPTAGRIGMTMPGSGAAAGMGGRTINLSKHRAIVLTIRVEGSIPKRGAQAVLNIQLESGSRAYRDHYVDLNFTGERTIVIPEPNTQRMLAEFWPMDRYYSFKSAMYGFNYKDVAAVNLRWMRTGTSPIKCTILRMEALTETEEVLKDPAIAIGDAKMTLPVKLQSGEYVEFMGEEKAIAYDRNGKKLYTFDLADVPMLEKGDNRISVSGKNMPPFELTTIMFGDALSF